VQSNCTVVIGDDAVLVVDSGQFPSLASRMVADIKKLTSLPVRYLVNTHWHLDHVWGNAVFRDAYPGLAIIGTEYTRQLIDEQGPMFPIKVWLTTGRRWCSFAKWRPGISCPTAEP
jgi:glyoxylase-like metal-dependent hydrolase (beta-lactamase superfamily II)